MPLALTSVLTSLGMHHETDIYGITNAGTQSCSLRGFPSISSQKLSGQASQITVLHAASVDGATDVPGTVVLPAKGIAYFYEFSGLPLNGPVCRKRRGRVQILVTGDDRAQKLDQDTTWAVCDRLTMSLTPYFSMSDPPAWLSQLSQEGYPLSPR